MKRAYITTSICSLLLIAIFFAVYRMDMQISDNNQKITVGFVYVGDESMPYTKNFIKAQRDVEKKFGDRINVMVKENVAEGTEEKSIRELVDGGCNLIFTTSYGYGDVVKEIAADYPDVEFCQATSGNANDKPVRKNYHTFMGHIYQGRYVAGVVAGAKLKELIKNGDIKASQAKIGYVAAFPYAEVISGYTAFLIGARSVVPETTMEVKYINTWNSYSLEKEAAKELIDDDCIIISQHSDTTGPAVACENESGKKKVYHVGYNNSMIDVAPTTSLISSKINWTPYIVEATEAVINEKNIEKSVSGVINGNDVGAGFERNWVQMLELNSQIAAKGTKKLIDTTIKNIKAGKISVFKGNYKGVDPFDSSDIYDLNNEYIENQKMSAPSFHYVLEDIIEIKE